jgi:hypothetical protein
MSIANNLNTYRSTQPISKCKLLLGKDDQLTFLEANRGGILDPLIEHGGIVFGNTPSLTFAATSSYTPYELAHTNYELNAFQKTTISDFQIQGAKLTSETRAKADYTLAVIHFLRTFSKMNYVDAGMPPRILYFSAYGDYMFNNVPVALGAFTIPLNDDIDYVQTSHGTQVPIVVNMNFSLRFMPTPSKMKQEFSLGAFARGDLLKKGYL